ncbi:hypothetical protein ACVWZW_007592 [Bradyrhizobium sp. F1.13.4]
MQHDAGLRLCARKPDRLVEQRLVLHDPAGLDAAARRQDQLWLRIVDAGGELFRGKAAEHDGVHSANARAGEHRDDGLRDHRHIEDDAIALGDTKILHDGGERLHFGQQFGVAEFGDAICQRRIMDQRDLVGAAAFDVAVERVVAGVDDATAVPAAVDALRGIEDLFRRLDPVDLLGRLGPKALRIGQRTRINLVIEAFSVDVSSDVHSRAPVPLSAWP